MTTPRFECVFDPCNFYTVWDNATGVPVMVGGMLQSYASRRRAERIAALLNAEAVAPSSAGCCGIAADKPMAQGQ